MVVDVPLVGPARLGGLGPKPLGYVLSINGSTIVWRLPTPLAAVTTMLFYPILFLLFVLVIVLSFRHLFVLEATDRFGAALILEGKNVGLSDAVAAAFRGGIRAHPRREIDTDISISHMEYMVADAAHPPLAQDWGETAAAALSSTRELVEYFKGSTGPDEVIRLDRFTRCVTLLTFLRLFFRLPITHAGGVQEVVWIIGKSWQMDGCWKDFIKDPVGLRHLVKSSPNPSGVLAVLSATQRLVLSALCLLEHRRDNIQTIRQAKALLQYPSSSGSAVVQLVEKTLQSYPPVQSVNGGVRFSLGRLPLHRTHGVDFFIPVDTLPPSDCFVGPDGTCISWLHKAALPGQSGCDGRAWLVRTAAIILSAVKTEIRQANLTIDGDGHDPEAWEEWILRRSRVG